MSNTAANLIASSNTFASAYLQRRYAILFYTLLLTFVASPLLAALQRESTFIEVLLATNLLVAVIPIRTGYARRALLVLVAIAFAGRLFTASLGEAFSSVNLCIWTVVGLLAAANALRSTLRATSIENEHIYAALSAYLLAGISLGVLYWALERVWPGSLNYGGAIPDSFSSADGIYFSFVTLATLGYGDFVPKTQVARGLAILEAVVGQLYLGVMVARLVSLYVSGTAAGKHAGPQVR
jgi:Ion channel